MPRPRWKTIRKIWIISGLTFAVLFNGFMILGRRATGFDKESILASGPRVTVTETFEQIAFTPREAPHRAALLFFPGAAVDPRAYAPLCRAIAEAGYETVIVKMPFRWALFESQRRTTLDRALAVMRARPRRWVVAGHSLGGAMAARFADEHPDRVAALVLLGTTHPTERDLSGDRFPVIKIYASNDGIAAPEKVESGRARLPAHTEWLRIEGGNHAQFGHYSNQPGDGDAAISREAQQRIIRDALVRALVRAGAS